jgi:sulfur-carrier protein adenylyltransferase/sulfurtransferase
MAEADFQELTPDALQRYMELHQEKDYLLIDVRQPAEYGEGHIPGAKLIPIMRLVSGVYDLPSDRDLIFYCRNGGRSTAAAALSAEEGVCRRSILHLTGGIMNWNGHVQRNHPKVKLFAKAESLAAQLRLAMDLEKGAFRFYDYLARRFDDEPFAAIFAVLATAETGHARKFHQMLKAAEDSCPDFESLFAGLKGDILEGGEDLEPVLRRVAALETGICLTLMELALAIETSAFDLYRSLADGSADRQVQEAFWSIAQAEKSHIQQLAEAVSLCDASG